MLGIFLKSSKDIEENLEFGEGSYLLSHFSSFSSRLSEVSFVFSIPTRIIIEWNYNLIA
jgi:hypothetical protein